MDNNTCSLSPCEMLCQDCAFYDVCDFPYMCPDSEVQLCDQCNFACLDYKSTFEIPF